MRKRRQKNISATFQKSRELNCYLKSKMTELASVTTASTHSFTQYLKRTCRCLELTSAAAYAEVQLYLNGFKHNTWNTSLQVKKSKAACLKTFLSAKPAEPLYWYSKLVQGTQAVSVLLIVNRLKLTLHLNLNSCDQLTLLLLLWGLLILHNFIQTKMQTRFRSSPGWLS